MGNKFPQYGEILIYSEIIYFLDGDWMASVDKRRSLISQLIRLAKEDAAKRNRRVDTIDPLLRIAKRMDPYMPPREAHKIARAALSVILNEPETHFNQTTLTAHIGMPA